MKYKLNKKIVFSILKYLTLRVSETGFLLTKSRRWIIPVGKGIGNIASAMPDATSSQ